MNEKRRCTYPRLQQREVEKGPLLQQPPSHRRVEQLRKRSQTKEEVAWSSVLVRAREKRNGKRKERGRVSVERRGPNNFRDRNETYQAQQQDQEEGPLAVQPRRRQLMRGKGRKEPKRSASFACRRSLGAHDAEEVRAHQVQPHLSRHQEPLPLPQL